MIIYCSDNKLYVNLSSASSEALVDVKGDIYEGLLERNAQDVKTIPNSIKGAGYIFVKCIRPLFCGGVAEFVDWEGSKPITIRWRLKERVPEYLHEAYGIQNHE